MSAHNTFADPEVVKEEKFEGYTMEAGTLTVKLPKCSIVLLRLKEEN